MSVCMHVWGLKREKSHVLSLTTHTRMHMDVQCEWCSQLLLFIILINIFNSCTVVLSLLPTLPNLTLHVYWRSVCIWFYFFSSLNWIIYYFWCLFFFLLSVSRPRFCPEQTRIILFSNKLIWASVYESHWLLPLSFFFFLKAQINKSCAYTRVRTHLKSTYSTAI